jgi:hypothetical protein
MATKKSVIPEASKTSIVNEDSEVDTAPNPPLIQAIQTANAL